MRVLAAVLLTLWAAAASAADLAGWRDARWGMDESALEDAFGMRTEILFSDIRRNPGLQPSLFQFEPPPGTDVIGEPEVVDNLSLTP